MDEIETALAETLARRDALQRQLDARAATVREANARLARARDEVRHLEEQTDDLRRAPPVAETPGATQLRHRRQLIRVAFFACNSLIFTIGARGIAHEYGWYFAILLSVPVFWAVGLAAEAMERIDE